MEFSNRELWDKGLTNNQDGYGRAIYTYAESWANLIEAKLAEGAKLEDIAKETSHQADVEGITGFMYGAAVATLANTWKHGDELRRWHNLDTQIGNEGEKANAEGKTLNPALLEREKLAEQLYQQYWMATFGTDKPADIGNMDFIRDDARHRWLKLADYVNGLTESHSRQLWLEAPWISVSERLPEQGVWVLVAHSDGGRFTDHIGEDGEWADAPWLTTHWTPIPPLTPKAESTPKPSPESK